MPVVYQIDHESRFVHARARGVVVLEEILESLDALAVQEAASYRKLIDAREAIPQLTDDDFMILAARVCVYRAFKPRGPVAVVVADVDTLEGVRRYANFMGGEDRPLHVFASLDKAQYWLEHWLEQWTPPAEPTGG